MSSHAPLSNRLRQAQASAHALSRPKAGVHVEGTLNGNSGNLWPMSPDVELLPENFNGQNETLTASQKKGAGCHQDAASH